MVSTLIIIQGSVQPVDAWGYVVHSEITAKAIELLPTPWNDYFSEYEDELRDASQDADRRKGADPAESGRHYDDQDAPHQDRDIPYPSQNWTLGVVAWAAENATRDLISALTVNDSELIIRYMGDIAHYVGDAAQPFHATKNYNGQLTGNNGIHSRFETQVITRNFDDVFDLTEFSDLILINDTYLMVEDQIATGLELVPEILEADDFADDSSTTDDQYYQIFYEQTKPILQERLTLAITNIANVWYSCLVSAGWIELTPETSISTSNSVVTSSDVMGTTTSILTSSQVLSDASSINQTPYPSIFLPISIVVLISGMKTRKLTKGSI